MLLDTHVLLWWKSDGARLSVRVRRAMEVADRLLVSPVSFWEVSMLVAEGRVGLDRDVHEWARDLLDEGVVQVASLTPTAGLVAGSLASDGFTGDPADALLYATARDHSVPLVTKDRRIRSFASRRREVKVIW